MSESDYCLSGGADGSDLLWGKAAKAMGHHVVHFSFAGARTKADKDEIVILTAAQLRIADEVCLRANQMLHRRFPPRSTHVLNLLRRNWYQVETAQSLYAISSLVNGSVSGGTAWAVAFFLIQHKMAACAAYVFDQETCHWHQWTGASWEPIYEPPMPEGIWAGIGTRNINIVGKLAICALMNYWPLHKKC